MRYVVVWIWLIVLPSGALATDRYASPAGGGAAPCTNAGTPCTLATANSAATAGDVVLLANGTYSSTTGLVPSGPGITFRALNRHQPLLRRTGSQAPVVDIRHANVVIDGLRIDASGGTGDGNNNAVEIDGDAGAIGGVIVKNSILENARQAILKIGRLNNITSCTVTHNIIREAGAGGNGEAIYLASASGSITVSECEIAYNVVSGFTQGGLELKEGATDIYMHHNDFFGMTYKEIGCACNSTGCKDTTEIGWISNGEGNRFEDNVFRDSAAIAACRRGRAIMEIPGGGANTVLRNVVYDIQTYDNNIVGYSGAPTGGTQTVITHNTFCNVLPTTMQAGAYSITNNPQGQTPFTEQAQGVCDTAEAELRSFALNTGTIQADGITSRWQWDMDSLFPLAACSASASAFSCTGSTTGAHVGQTCSVQNETETFVTFAAPFVQGETVTCSVAAGTVEDDVPAGSWQFGNRVITAEPFTNNSAGEGFAENLLTVANAVPGTCPACVATRPWAALYDLDLTTEEGSAAAAAGVTSITGEHDLGSVHTLDNFEAYCDNIGTFKTQKVTVRTKEALIDAYTTIINEAVCDTNAWATYDMGNVDARYIEITFICDTGCGGTQAREARLFETPQTEPSPGPRLFFMRGGTLQGGRMGKGT